MYIWTGYTSCPLSERERDGASGAKKRGIPERKRQAQPVRCQTFFWHFVIASLGDTCQQSDSHFGGMDAPQLIYTALYVYLFLYSYVYPLVS